MKRRADDAGRQDASTRIGSLLTVLALAWTLVWADGALAQTTGGAPRLPADPWPREVTLAGATLLIYQPQVSSWQGNTLALRAAVAVRPTGGKQETFGVVWATARTQVDRVSRIVSLEDFTVTRSDFPTLPDRGATYLSALQTRFAASQRTVALDRLEASLAVSEAAKPTEIAVSNDPPRIMISETPALLVPIDGAPVVRPVPGTIFERVINTRALVIREQGTSTWYLHVYDGWLSAGAVAGPWARITIVPPALGPVTQQLARSGQVDLLDGGNTKPKPSLSAGVPTIYADNNGNVYKNSGSGWQQHTSNGWQSASGDTSWADREQQARSDGQDRFSSFSQSGGGWGDRFGGGGWASRGGGWGDRFGESGRWGGRSFGGGRGRW